MGFLCLLLPASISILVSEKLQKEKRSNRDLVISYLGYTFIITLIMNIIYYYINSSKINYFTEEIFTFGFSIQYMLISLGVAIASACLLFIISKVVQIDIVVKERKRKRGSKKIYEEDLQYFAKNYKRKH